MTSRNPAVPHDTEDKQYWYLLGCRDELDFCLHTAPRAGLTVRVNPAKAQNPTTIDLLRTLADGTEVPTDLKSQTTPFFTARRYGKDPARTVTFNLKDLAHYERRYPAAHLLFHVRWTQTAYPAPPRKPTVTVPPLEGVWLTTVPEVRRLVDAGRAPVHTYLHRMADTLGNARDSYLLSLGDLQELARFR